MSLGYASNRPRPGMGRVDDLPEEFSMVEVSLSSLTATLTAVVGQFILSTAGSNQIEEALRHEYSPEVRYRQGAFRNFNPPMQQAKAVRDVRQRLRGGRVWVAQEASPRSLCSRPTRRPVPGSGVARYRERATTSRSVGQQKCMDRRRRSRGIHRYVDINHY